MRIVKVPGYCSEETRICQNAGNLVISELRKIGSSEKGKLIDVSLLDVEEIRVDNLKIEERDNLIFENGLEEFKSRDKVIFLGGDISINRALIGAFSQGYESACFIVVSSRVSEIVDLIDSRFLLVGAGNLKREEIENLSQKRVKRIDLNLIELDMAESTDAIMEFSYGRDLFFIFDFSALDSAYRFSPSGEPGGLTGRQVIYLLSRIGMMKNLRAMSFSGIDGENKEAVRLGAKLVSEVL